MKKLQNIFLTLCLILSLSACSNADEKSTLVNLENTVEKPAEFIMSNEPKNQVRYFIAPKRVDCIGVAPQQCLQVKKQKTDDWSLFYTNIEGFTFEEGYNYEIIVETEKIAAPPMDSSSIRYILIDIVSKKPAE